MILVHLPNDLLIKAAIVVVALLLVVALGVTVWRRPS